MFTVYYPLYLLPLDKGKEKEFSEEGLAPLLDTPFRIALAKEAPPLFNPPLVFNPKLTYQLQIHYTNHNFKLANYGGNLGK